MSFYEVRLDYRSVFKGTTESVKTFRDKKKAEIWRDTHKVNFPGDLKVVKVQPTSNKEESD